VRNALPGSYLREAERLGVSPYEYVEAAAAKLAPGENGLLALDWWNGNRSTLVDASVSGLIVGATIATRPEHIYRALLESTAFGSRVIVDAFQEAGVAVDSLVASGGLPDRSPLLMQLFADVCNRDVYVAASAYVPSLGAAMYASVAAGPGRQGYATIEEAAEAMGHLREHVYRPRREMRAVYDDLYAAYGRLYDYFGRGANDVMPRLRQHRLGAVATSTMGRTSNGSGNL
jgi:L-ribulokinase